MIVITSLTSDVDGAIVIHEDSANTDFGEVTRRQTRVATLDGGAVLQDRGYSDTDLTFSIAAKEYSKTEFDRIRQFINDYPEVRLSCRIGTFIGALTDLVDADADFKFLVTGDG